MIQDGKFILPLPVAIASKTELKQATEAMGKIVLHMEMLERQIAFFRLRDFLAKKFPEVKSMRFEAGTHYDDEGYSDHVNMSVDVLGDDGALATHESDEESGCFYEAEKYQQLSDFVHRLPKHVFEALEHEEIDASNERALASAVMGPEGFAHYEAAVIAAEAQKGVQGNAAKARL